MGMISRLIFYTRASRVERPVGEWFFVVVLCLDRPPPTSVRQVGAPCVFF
jgi:hypothetical protein